MKGSVGPATLQQLVPLINRRFQSFAEATDAALGVLAGALPGTIVVAQVEPEGNVCRVLDTRGTGGERLERGSLLPFVVAGANGNGDTRAGARRPGRAPRPRGAGRARLRRIDLGPGRAQRRPGRRTALRACDRGRRLPLRGRGHARPRRPPAQLRVGAGPEPGRAARAAPSSPRRTALRPRDRVGEPRRIRRPARARMDALAPWDRRLDGRRLRDPGRRLGLGIRRGAFQACDQGRRRRARRPLREPPTTSGGSARRPSAW